MYARLDVRYALRSVSMKHTSLYLDEDLLAEASRILGTDGPTSTVRTALESVIRTRRLESLASWEIELTPDDLAAIRRPRLEDGS
jgi:Arc/MetJ family transcription regulator